MIDTAYNILVHFLAVIGVAGSFIYITNLINLTKTKFSLRKSEEDGEPDFPLEILIKDQELAESLEEILVWADGFLTEYGEEDFDMDSSVNDLGEIYVDVKSQITRSASPK